MPETKTAAEPIADVVAHMKQVSDHLGRGLEPQSEDELAERELAVEELKAGFPGADAETLVRIAAYVADIGIGMERQKLDGYAIAWGFAQFATVLAEDLETVHVFQPAHPSDRVARLLTEDL